MMAWAPDVLRRAIVGEMQPPAMDLGALFWGKEVAVSQLWGTAEAALHPSTSLALSSPDRNREKKSCTYVWSKATPGSSRQHGSYNERDLLRSSSGGGGRAPPATGSYCL